MRWVLSDSAGSDTALDTTTARRCRSNIVLKGPRRQIFSDYLLQSDADPILYSGDVCGLSEKVSLVPSTDQGLGHLF